MRTALIALSLSVVLNSSPCYLYGQQPLKNTYTPPLFAEGSRLQKIAATKGLVDSLYKAHAAANHFPGMVYGVIADGQLLYSGTMGYTVKDKKTPVTTQAAFRIASMTKSFTAMAIMQLRDVGKLQLDEPVEKYIHDFRKINYPSTDAPAITIRHLLNHVGGFPQDDPWADRQLEASDKELMEVIRRNPAFSNIPGLVYEYSNLGYTLLGKIVSTVSRKPYQQYITENILKPLGMQNTYWEYSKVPVSQLAKGHRWQNGDWIDVPLLHDGAYGAMGGLITTLEDFSKYLSFHMEAWPARSGAESNVLKRSSLREMHQPGIVGSLNAAYKYPSGRACPTVSGYGFGLRWSKDCEGRVQVGHSGGLPGFGSNWTFLPDFGIGVVCFANVTYAPTANLNITVLDTLLRLGRLQPRQIVTSPVLQQRKEQLAKLLPDWKGAEASGLFAENFFVDFPIDSLRKEAATLFAKAGRIVRIHDIIPDNQLRGRFIIEGEKTDIEVFFTLMPDNPPLIQDYRIR